MILRLGDQLRRTDADSVRDPVDNFEVRIELASADRIELLSREASRARHLVERRPTLEDEAVQVGGKNLEAAALGHLGERTPPRGELAAWNIDRP